MRSKGAGNTAAAAEDSKNDAAETERCECSRQKDFSEEKHNSCGYENQNKRFEGPAASCRTIFHVLQARVAIRIADLIADDQSHYALAQLAVFFITLFRPQYQGKIHPLRKPLSKGAQSKTTSKRL